MDTPINSTTGNKQKMNRYRLQRAPDGITWVSIDPLIQDVREQMAQPNQPQHVLTALQYVDSFLASLILESNQLQFQKSLKDSEEEATYKETLQ
jgi:hypothetical protein